MTEIFKFVGLSLKPSEPWVLEQARSQGNKNLSPKPVLDETKELLRQFYEPFNVELAQILGDKKWLWV